jgi:hypothetical protein
MAKENDIKPTDVTARILKAVAAAADANTDTDKKPANDDKKKPEDPKKPVDPKKPEDKDNWKDMDPAKWNFASFNKTAIFFYKMTTMTCKQKFEALKANLKMIAEPSKTQKEDIRKMIRKTIKPLIRKSVMEYYSTKLAAFRTQKVCYAKLMKVHMTMQCASADANKGGLVQDPNDAKKWTMNLKKRSAENFVDDCTKNAWHQIKLGNAYTEAMG